MSRAARIAALGGLGLLVVGLVLAQFTASEPGGERVAGPSSEDPGPDGLLGLALLLQDSGHDVERLADAPSDSELDAGATAFLAADVDLTAADADALRDAAADGGRVVVAGDPGEDALGRILDGTAEVTAAGGSASSRPLVPSPETSGIVSVAADGEARLDDPGPALPILGADGGVLAAVADVEEGQVVVVAESAVLQNELITTADNARFALNLAGTAGRPVQLIEAVRVAPESGLAALPSQWGWVLGLLVLTAVALAAARGRRLGPPELESRPLPPPRREYVDAVAGALMRTRDPATAAEPLRAAARERLARRAGLGPDPAASDLRRAAEAAGLAPEEVRAIEGGVGDENAMLAAGVALAKLGRRA